MRACGEDTWSYSGRNRRRTDRLYSGGLTAFILLEIAHKEGDKMKEKMMGETRNTHGEIRVVAQTRRQTCISGDDIKMDLRMEGCGLGIIKIL